MMYLNRNLSLRADQKKQKINFFNGKYQEIETDNFEALWNLFEICSEGIENFKDPYIEKWSKQYGYTSEETIDILNFLNEEGLLSAYNSLDDDSFEARNKRFYSIYKRNPDIFLNTLRSQTILIMGVGTIGSTLALTLAKLGIGKIILLDNDIIEPKNLSAQAVYTTDDINLDKTEVLKKKIYESSPQVEIHIIKEFVDEQFLKSLPKLIEDHLITFAISCFDTGTFEIHSQNFETFKKYDVNYILTGYLQGKVIAKLLDFKNEISEIKDLYNNYDEKYYLGVNQGTILHSYASSILVSNLIQKKLGLYNKEEFNKELEFDIVDINDFKKSDKKEPDKSAFYQSLSAIIEPKIISSKIKRINLDLKKNLSDDESKNLELEILNLHQYFKLLELFDSSLLEAEKEQFESLFFSLTADDNFNKFEKNEEIYSPDSYKEFINGLEVNGLKLHKVLTLINSESNYEKRIELQKNVFEKIHFHSEYLLKCLVYNKKKHLLNDYEKNEMLEVNGINIENIEMFEKEFSKNLEDRILKIFNLVFKKKNNENTKYDYLYEIDVENKISMSLEETIDFQKNVFINNYPDTNFGTKLLSHLNKIINGNYILNRQGLNILTTFYFPFVNESRIVVDYYDSMVVLQNLVHEIGHSYYNQNYDKNFFDKSEIIVNETLAILYEVIFHNTLFEDKEVTDSKKVAFAYHYLHRLNKMVTSPLGLLYLENNLINHIKENDNLSFKSFIEIRKSTKSKLFPNIHFENEENSYANVFINSSFVLNFKEGIISSIATTLAIYLFNAYQNNLDLLDEKIKVFLTNPDTGLDNFCLCIVGRKYDGRLLNEISLSFDSHLDSIEYIMKNLSDSELSPAK